MYDPRMEPHEFVGDEREEAVQKACKFFGVEADALEVTDFETGEIYGAGGRTVIVAVPQGAERPRPDDRPPRDREGRGGRGARGERGDRGGRGERGERGDRGGRRGRGRREPRAAEREAPRERAPTRAAEPPELDDSDEPSVGTALGDLDELGQFVQGVVERLDLGPFEVSESQDAELVVVHVRGPAARRLGQGDGRASDALQLLANQAARRMEDEDFKKVVVEVEGDAEGRESLLVSLAERVARRARSSGRAVALDPMNPRDRRTVHMALRDEEDVATMSVGEGRYRQVVVVPEGAPEYEQARRESREIAERSSS